MGNKKRSKEPRFGAHNVAADSTRRRNEAKSYGYLKIPKGVQVFKEKVSKGKKKTYVDILPYIVNDESHLDANPDNPMSALPGNPWYKKPIYVHRSIGADNESIICLKTIGEKCPACTHRKVQEQQGFDKEELISKAVLRNLYLLFPIDDEEYDAEEFHVWDISNGNFQSQLDEELEENPDNGVFPDLEFGMTLEVRFSEESFAGNKFAQASRINFLERDEPYDESLQDEIPCLDDMIVILTPEEIQAKLLDLDPEDLQDERPSRKAKPGAGRKRKPVKDEEPEEEPDDDDDDEPKERSSRRKPGKETTSRTSRRRRAKDEDEPEEEPDDDDESEEKPKPSRRTGKAKTGKKPKLEECPEGYEFGQDFDEYDECEDCPIFNECGTAYEKNNR